MFSTFTQAQLRHFLEQTITSMLSILFLYFSINFIYFMCLHARSYVYLCSMCVYGVCRVEKTVVLLLPGIGIRKSCKPPYVGSGT